MVIISRDEYVWVLPPKEKLGEFTVPIGGVVQVIEGNRYVISDDDGNEYYIKGNENRLKIMHPSSVEGVEDMIGLGDLHEAGILRNLLIRYREGYIYTYTGSILVAVNPYQVLPIYTPDHVKKYRQKKIGELPPHIFAIADNAYSNLFRIGNQCVIISGESGAGKTESTKIVLQFLAAISGQHSWIEQQILESNPILEAFGNAKTIRNDNSSRFGKYIDIQFNKTGSIEGACIEQYLLEKSRIVHQAQDERNYHVFYCMLAGMAEDEKKRLYLTHPNDYFYLTQGGGSLICEGREDAKEYLNILSAMKVLLFGKEEIYDIFQLLAIILHLGNLRYKGKTIKNLDACEISNPSTLEPLSNLLRVNSSELIRALTTKTLITGGETVVSTLGAERSMDVRDAFCKGIYGKLFVWIVDKINKAIKAPTTDTQHSNGSVSLSNGYGVTTNASKPSGPIVKTSNLGVLDIFGFENFQFNSFEQFCINYANENLQQFFIRHIFKLEQEEYNLEGINWQHIDFVDNQETLNLIAGKPLHIVSLIDEESRFPKGTDYTLLDKLNHTHRKHKSYVEPKSDTCKYFGINHFAGLVYYDVQGFVEKNRDTFSADLLSLIYNTENKFLHGLFHKERMLGPETRKKSPTLSLQFKKSLDMLMKALETCQPFFIRCIKPNDHKRPGVFDRELVVKQLRYSGMMETIRIRRNGYPIRHNFHDFFQRYKHLVSVMQLKHAGICQFTESPNKAQSYSSASASKDRLTKEATASSCNKKYVITDYRAAVKIICSAALGPKSDFQIGHTKVFLKDCQDLYLEQARERALTQMIVLIQKMVKGWIARKKFSQLKKAASVIQTYWRGLLHRRRFVAMYTGISRLQALIKARNMHNEYLATRQFMIQLQAACRGYLVRKDSKKLIEEARKNRKKRVEPVKSPLKYKQSDISGDAKLNGDVKKLNLSTTDEQAAIEELFGDLHLDVDEEDEEEAGFNNQVHASTKNFKSGTNAAKDKLKAENKSNLPSAFKDLGKLSQQGSESSPNTPIAKGEYDKYFEELSLLDSVTVGVNVEPYGLEDSLLQLDDVEESGYEEYKFAKFAATYFQGNITPNFSRAELKHPLLPLKNPGDVLASLDVWIMILRFMGDMSEPVERTIYDSSQAPEHYFHGRRSLSSKKGISNSPNEPYHQPVQNLSVMNKIYTTLSRTAGKTIASDESFVNYTRKNLADYDSGNFPHLKQVNKNKAHPNLSGGSSGTGHTLRKKLISLTLKKKSKMPVDLLSRCGQDNHHNLYRPCNMSNGRLPNEDDDGLFESLKERPMTNLEKLHFIIGNGILRPRLRDEIYCQICKQLTNNPNPDTSRIKGWLLLSLCLGCFPTSQVFEKYLINFLLTSHQSTRSNNRYVVLPDKFDTRDESHHLSIDFAARCLHRLKRTRKNGARTQPPSWLELQAAKASIAAVYGTKCAPNNYSKKCVDLSLIENEPPIILPVTCMDGRTENLPADCSTTSRELCLLLSFRLGLIPIPSNPKGVKNKTLTNPENIGAAFGFSLYVALFDKVSSLGDGDDHVMDAVSQCEQYAKETGAQERNAPWRLFFRKEIFCPWREEHLLLHKHMMPSSHRPSHEPNKCVNLIYQQIVRGIKFGEYRCEKDEDLAIIASQQHFVNVNESLAIKNGARNASTVNIDPAELMTLLPSYIPDCYLQRDGDLEHWISMIMSMSQKLKLFEQGLSPQKVKEEIVNYAKYKWPLLFSRFYEASLMIATSPHHTLDGVSMVSLKQNYNHSADPYVDTNNNYMDNLYQDSISPVLAQNLRKNEDIIIAVNWTGFYAVDDAERVLLELSFPEIVKVNYIPIEKANYIYQNYFVMDNLPEAYNAKKGTIKGRSNPNAQMQGTQPLLCIMSAREEVLVFRCSGAKDVSSLMNFFLDGLKKRSKYAVAMRDFMESDASFLSFKKGEIIILEKPFANMIKDDILAARDNDDKAMQPDNKTRYWLSGRSLTTQSKGDVPSDYLYIIPSLSAPDPDVVKQLANNASLSSPTLSPSSLELTSYPEFSEMGEPISTRFGQMINRLFMHEDNDYHHIISNPISSIVDNNGGPYRSSHNLAPDNYYQSNGALLNGGRYTYQNVSQPNDASNNKIMRVYDLQQFSKIHFRNPEKNISKKSFSQTISSTLSRKNPLKNFLPNDKGADAIDSNYEMHQGSANTAAAGEGSGEFNKNSLWTHDKEPLRLPLLKKLVTSNETLCYQACLISLSISKYMGDQPLRRKLNYKTTSHLSINNNSTSSYTPTSPPLPTHSVDLTDSIFAPPIKNELLRDELYCQLIKQLTANPNKTSEGRGWELMWLATGCFSCSRLVLPELTEFIRTSYQAHQAVTTNSDLGISGSNFTLKKDCMIRLQKSLKVGPRKYPPHPVEVEAIQRKTTQIFHKVYFPDDTEQAFEVDSGTKASEFCFHISRRLSLLSSQGFSLFVKIADKVISVPDADFFFDFVRHLTDWIKKTCPSLPAQNLNPDGSVNSQNSGAASLTYQIFFMRKLWLNVIPGVDRNADIIFHYHQEVPKYLRGYHKCSVEEAKVLGALIYRVKYGCDPTMLTSLSTFGKIVKDLVPPYLLRGGPDGNINTITANMLEDWRKSISFYYSQTGDIGDVHSLRNNNITISPSQSKVSTSGPSNYSLTSDDAKIEFLKRVYQWPTFGSAFFEIKQTTEPNLPEYLLIAINKNGVTLIDPDTKDVLTVFPFTQISNWSSGNTYFHLTIGNLIQGSKLLCETSLGYKMDDLLTSYIGLMLSTMTKQQKHYTQHS